MAPPTDRLQTQTVIRPAGDEPLHVRGDGVDVLDVLLGRVRVVHAQVALPAELPGDAEVQADGLGVADVEVTVGLRRETRHHAGAATRGQVLLDHLPEEVLVLLRRLVLVHVRVRHGAPAAPVIAAPHSSEYPQWHYYLDHE